MEKKYDVVIIGGGTRRLLRGAYHARAGLSTLVLEMLSAGGQMATIPHRWKTTPVLMRALTASIWRRKCSLGQSGLARLVNLPR